MHITFAYDLLPCIIAQILCFMYKNYDANKSKAWNIFYVAVCNSIEGSVLKIELNIDSVRPEYKLHFICLEIFMEIEDDFKERTNQNQLNQHFCNFKTPTANAILTKFTNAVFKQ